MKSSGYKIVDITDEGLHPFGDVEFDSRYGIGSLCRPGPLIPAGQGEEAGLDDQSPARNQARHGCRLGFVTEPKLRQ